MQKKLILMLLALMCGSFAASSPAQPPSPEFRDYIYWLGQQRRASRQRAEIWRDERLELYRRRLRANEIEVAEQESEVYTVYEDELSVPAGTYTLDMADGASLPVEVTKPTEESLGAVKAERVHLLVDQVTRNLKLLQTMLSEGENTSQLPHELGLAIDLAEQLRDVTGIKPNLDETPQVFRKFQRQWQEVSFALKQSPDIGPAGRSRIAAVHRLNDEILQSLKAPVADAFDRLQAMASSGPLAEAAGEMAQALQAADANPPFQAAAAAAAKKASVLTRLIRKRAALPTVIEAYEEWDESWTKFVAIAEEAPALPPEIAAIGRRVRKLDSRLHAQLMVDPPSYQEQRPLENILAALGKTTDFLARELRGAQAPSEVLLPADGLAMAARDIFENWSDDDPHLYMKDYARLADHWEQVRAAMGDASFVRFDDAHQAARMIESLLARLKGRVTE